MLAGRFLLCSLALIALPVLARSDVAADAVTEGEYPEPPPSQYDLLLKQRGALPQPPPERAFIAQGLRTLVVLALVVALAYLSLRLLRRFMGKGVLKGSGDEIRVLARTYVEPKRTLLIVQVGSRFFLIGSAEQGMVMLAELEAKDVPAARGDNVGIGGKLFSRVLASNFERESDNLTGDEREQQR